MWASPPTHRLPKSHASHSGGADPSAPTTLCHSLSFPCHSEPVLTLAWESAPPVPCLSLWERWPSAARTERANKEGPPPGGPSFSSSINPSCHSEEHPKGTCFAARSDVGIRIPAPAGAEHPRGGLSKGTFRACGRGVLLPTAAKVPKNAVQTCGLKIPARLHTVRISTTFPTRTLCHANFP